MCPPKTLASFPNSGSSNPQLASYVCVASRVFAYAFDHVSVELSPWSSGRHMLVVSSARELAKHVSGSALRYHVVHVILVRASKQVRRVAARRIVASVQDQKAVWHWTVSQQPRQPMRAPKSTAYTYEPVTSAARGAGPNKAIGLLNKSRRETLLDVRNILAQKNVVEIHRASPWLGARAGSSACNTLPPAFSTNPAASTQAA